MADSKIIIIGLILTTLLITPAALAAVGPAAWLTEQVRADYNWNGTIDTSETGFGGACGGVASQNPCRYGYSEVGVPNTQDVLQNIRINISSTTYTNLSSKQAYKGALASPTGNWARNKIHFNSSADGYGDDDDYYNITNATMAPSIKLNFTYANDAGGEDLYDEDNIKDWGTGYTGNNSLTFTLTVENPSTSRALSGVDVAIQFQTNTNGVNDIVEITGTSVIGGGSVNTENDGDDGTDDKVTWSGDLGTSSEAEITIDAISEAGINFGQSDNSIDLDVDPGAEANWANTSNSQVYLTQKGMPYKFSKGPIRQGVDLANSTAGWRVRAFMKNMGNNTFATNFLTYDISEWALWNVSQDGSLGQKVHNGTFTPSELTPDNGTIYTTDKDPFLSSNTSWYTTGSEKPHFASEFEWEVVWNDTNAENYYAFINTSLNMPQMYKIDLYNEKGVDGVISPNTEGENLTVTDTTNHTGHSETKADVVRVHSVVPGSVSGGGSGPTAPDTWFKIFDNTIGVYFVNSSGEYEITTGTQDVTVNVNQPTSDGNNGLVNVTISDATATVINGYLNTSEQIKVNYTIQTNATMQPGDTFTFDGNSSMTSKSGTPIMEPLPETNKTVSGKTLSGYKDLVGYEPTQPTLINGSIVVTVNDETDAQTGIDGVRFMDYVPAGANDTFSTDDVRVSGTYNGGTDITTTGEYCINYTGSVELGGVQVYAYEYMKNCTEDTGWHMDDGDQINASYRLNITTSGLYEMPATLIGLDPVTGATLRSRPVGVVRVNVPEPKKPLDISQGSLDQAERLTVGNPGQWVKRVQVFNPNARPVEGEFEAKIFEDAEKAWITYTDEEGKQVRIEGTFQEKEGGRFLTWKDEIGPIETRSYQVRVITPPAVEVNRDVKVLEEVSGKKVKLKMDIYVRNFAKETYEDVIMNLPIPYTNVEEVRDGFGDSMKFTGGKDSTTVFIDEMESGKLKTVTIIYNQPYPTIIVTPERDTLQAGSSMNISVLVINGGQEIDYPKIETEIYGPDMQVVRSEIKELEKLEPLEKTELSERYEIPVNLPSGKYVAEARFRKDFTTLASGTGKFYVESSFGPGGRTIPAIILLVAIVGVSYLSYKRLRSVTGGEE